MFRPPQRTVQQESFGFAHRPQQRFHRVPAQLFEGGDALVAIDHQVAIRLAFYRHHHDRRLLARRDQRRQKSALPRRMAHPEMFAAPIELVKLQSHARRSLPDQYAVGGHGSFPSGAGSAPGSVVRSLRCSRIWSFAERTRRAPITPTKSAALPPISSFATSQGSRFSGAGKRSGSGARS
jgi:hypothetical protein